MPRHLKRRGIFKLITMVEKEKIKSNDEIIFGLFWIISTKGGLDIHHKDLSICWQMLAFAGIMTARVKDAYK